MLSINQELQWRLMEQADEAGMAVADYAVAVLALATRKPKGPHTNPARDHKIYMLWKSGQNNSEIARTMSLSRLTVKTVLDHYGLKSNYTRKVGRK